MKNSFLVAVDGSPGSDKAVAFATERAKLGGATVIIAYVIEWSPYTFSTPEENAIRHKRREEELDRANNQVVDPIAASLREAGLTVETVVRHGHPANTIIELAEEHDVAQIFIGRRGASGLREMMFGSVASNLMQGSPIPVTVVP